MIVVTGGTKGIGRAIIEAFAHAGYDIATCARKKDELAELKASVEGAFGNRVYVQSADLSRKEDCQHFCDFVLRTGQPVEVLVNNTGLFIPGSIHSEEPGTLETLIETNLYSAYYVTRGLIGQMMERKQGHIFNMASIASFVAYANGGSYAIAKHALLGFSKCIREEMKPHGIRVTTIMPGATYTASWAGVDLPEERFMQAADVGQAVLDVYRLSERTVVEEMVLRPQLGDI